MLRPSCLLLCLALVGCDDGPPGSDPGSCAGAVAGPSGGAATDRVVLCVLDEDGAAVPGAAVSVSGMSVGVSDDTGKLEVDYTASSAIEISAAGLVPHTLLGVSSRRFGVVLPRASAGTRTITGTLSGINELHLPPDGYRRVVEIRGGNAFTPLSLTDGLAIGAPADCTLAGDTCTFSVEVDERVTHLNATVIDATSAFSDRLVAAFAIGAVDGTTADFAISGRDGGLSEISVDAGTDIVIGVPGARVGDDVLLFGSPTATDTVPVPSEALGGTAWLAMIYTGPSDELHAGVVQRPSASTSAPPAPGVSIDGATLTLPSQRVSTISLGAGNTELWRATVLDGRTTVSVPTGDADRVAVIVHGASATAVEEGATRAIQAVVTLAITR
ncbi:MAG: hypothetical protein H6719_17530 [Sandaracinaceae bacterium]|nr:hypothetical protein [Sandaracinaceae bacterium]